MNDELSHTQPRTILLVEGCEADAFILRDLLEEYEPMSVVVWIRDGEAALEYMRSLVDGACLPAVILLDVTLLRRADRELLRLMRADGLLGGVPMIALSRSGSPEDMRDSYELKAKLCLAKPRDLMGWRALVARLSSDELSRILSESPV